MAILHYEASVKHEARYVACHALLSAGYTQAQVGKAMLALEEGPMAGCFPDPPDEGQNNDDTGEWAAPPSEDDPLEQLAHDFDPEPEPFIPSEDDLASYHEWSAEIDRRWRDEQIERGEPEFPGILPPDLARTLAYQDCR